MLGLISIQIRAEASAFHCVLPLFPFLQVVQEDPSLLGPPGCKRGQHSVIYVSSDQQNVWTQMKQVIHLLSCQTRLPHRSNETHQAL